MDQSDLHNKAVSCGIKHIGIAIYSSGKIFVYLLNKGFPEDICQSAVNELIERKYIDDTKASRKVLIARTGKKQESKEYIRKRLEAAGISSDVADSVVSGLESDTRTCYKLFEALGFSEDSEEVRDEMIKTAVRRGYPYELASRVYELWSQNI